MTLLRRWLGIASHNWAQKLGAIVLALVMWLFITTSSVSTTQRSMLVPLVVEGVAASQVAAGVPGMVEVSVSGPNARINRLRAESITATLDLSGLSGDFQQQVLVQPPQGVTLVNVNPGDVIGFLETVTNRTLGVTPSLSGSAPPDVMLSVVAEPDAVTITGRSQLLQRVARVMVAAPARAGASQSRPFAVDAAGVPITDVDITPDEVTLRVTAEPALAIRTVPLELESPTTQTLLEATLDQAEVTLAGPEATLAGIERVRATVDPPTGTPEPGRYTVPVRLDLPPGVAAIGIPTAELRYGPSPVQP